jgi:hypothetical protein
MEKSFLLDYYWNQLETGWWWVEGCSTPQVAIMLRNNSCKDDFRIGLLYFLHVKTALSSLSALMFSILSFHSSFTTNHLLFLPSLLCLPLSSSLKFTFTMLFNTIDV